MNKCEHCGTETENGPNPDPYLQEIAEEIVMVVLCDTCYRDRRQEI